MTLHRAAPFAVPLFAGLRRPSALSRRTAPVTRGAGSPSPVSASRYRLRRIRCHCLQRPGEEMTRRHPPLPPHQRAPPGWKGRHHASRPSRAPPPIPGGGPPYRSEPSIREPPRRLPPPRRAPAWRGRTAWPRGGGAPTRSGWIRTGWRRGSSGRGTDTHHILFCNPRTIATSSRISPRLLLFPINPDSFASPRRCLSFSVCATPPQAALLALSRGASRAASCRCVDGRVLPAAALGSE
mmetsp:Transcript_18360/g.37207  ORF Transcript_18360/g.37207 Transcript_18360/m.37207 type:complete len:239 (-) Transcript_18360:34-750(-)